MTTTSASSLATSASDWSRYFEAAAVRAEELANCKSARQKAVKIGKFLGPLIGRCVRIEVKGRVGTATLRAAEGRSREKRYWFDVRWDDGGPPVVSSEADGCSGPTTDAFAEPVPNESEPPPPLPPTPTPPAATAGATAKVDTTTARGATAATNETKVTEKVKETKEAKGTKVTEVTEVTEVTTAAATAEIAATAESAKRASAAATAEVPNGPQEIGGDASGNPAGGNEEIW